MSFPGPEPTGDFNVQPEVGPHPHLFRREPGRLFARGDPGELELQIPELGGAAVPNEGGHLQESRGAQSSIQKTAPAVGRCNGWTVAMLPLHGTSS